MQHINFSVTLKQIEIMKKVMLMVAFMVATVAASAQVYIGGGIGFSSEKEGYANGDEEPDAATKFHFTPEIGYNLSDKLAVGLGLNFTTTKPNDDIKYFDFEIAPYARWTFVKWNRVSLFLEGGLAYGFNKEKEDIPSGNKTETVEKKDSYFKIGVKPGLRVDLTDHVALMTRVGWLGYECRMPDGEDMNNGSRFGLDVDGENLTFGVLYTF